MSERETTEIPWVSGRVVRPVLSEPDRGWLLAGSMAALFGTLAMGAMGVLRALDGDWVWAAIQLVVTVYWAHAVYRLLRMRKRYGGRR